MVEKGLDYLQSNTKRGLDIVGGMAAAAVFLPIGVGVGIASAVDTRCLSPLLTQERVGGHQEDSFKAIKFRTLRCAVGELAAWQSFGTFDPRASRLGLFIRQSGLDEAPQLLNVITGRMSLVGTRPLAVPDLDRNQSAAPKLFDEWYDYFKTVKPGLVCESQIYRHHYRENTPQIIATSMEMDLRYFDTASFKEDVKWIFLTPAGMVRASINVIENAGEI